MKRIIFIVAAILLSLSISAQGATYYVKPTGSDAADGLSNSNAWEHIQMACSTLVAGDTVFIRAGTYDENSPYTIDGVDAGFRFNNNGTSGNCIVAKGYPGDALPLILGDTTAANMRFAGSFHTKSYHVFDSLEFRWGWKGVYMENGSYDTLKYCVVDSCGWQSAAGNNVGGFISYNNDRHDVHHIGVLHCTFFDNWDVGETCSNCSGIHIYVCDTCEFAYNTIYAEAKGIWIKGPLVGAGHDTTININIHHNTIYGLSSSSQVGILVGSQGSQMDISIHHNTIWDDGGMMAGIATGFLGVSVSSAEIHRIFIYNNTVDGGSDGGGYFNKWAYFTDNGGGDTTFNTDSIEVFNNIFYDIDGTGGGSNVDYAVANLGCAGSEENGVGHIGRFYSDYNMIHDENVAGDQYHWWQEGEGNNYWTLTEWRSNSTQGNNSVLDDPEFTDPNNHDYSIRADSPAATGGRGGSYDVYFGASAPPYRKVKARR